MGKNSAVGKLMFSINVFWIKLKWVGFVCNLLLTPYQLHFILCWNWAAAISVVFTSVTECIFPPHIIFNKATIEHISEQRKADESEWMTTHSKRNCVRRASGEGVANLLVETWGWGVEFKSEPLEACTSMEMLFRSCSFFLPMLMS